MSTTRTMVDLAEPRMHSDAQELFKEIHTASQRGELTSTLRRKVEADPSCSISLIQVLLAELEKKQKRVGKVQQPTSYMSIVPVLHTLYYVVIQSGVTVPNSLYQKVIECLTKLLILPLPYSGVALQTLRSTRMEMNTPGSLYLRRIITEQNLKNEHFNLHEKVFVMAATKEFSAPLEALRRAYWEVTGSLSSGGVAERKAVLHALHSGLEITCGRSELARALQALDDDQARKHFREVVHAVKTSVTQGPGGHAEYLSRLQDVYGDIMAASEGVPTEITAADRGALCGATMPYPDMEFFMWNDEEDLWNLLTQFTLHSDKDKGNRDSGIERDISENGGGEAAAAAPRVEKLKRRGCLKNSRSMEKLYLLKDKVEEDPGHPAVVQEERSHTARVVVLGDDRVLGTLTRAYHSLREKESKHNMLTKKLNLQLYYIPITKAKSDVSTFLRDGRFSLASYLRRVDPWYNSNISNLEDGLSRLSTKSLQPPSPSEASEKNLNLLDTLCYYLRCGTQPVNLPLYSVKLFCNSSDATSVVETVFVSHLKADIEEFRHLWEKSLKEKISGRKKSYKHFGAMLSVSYTKASLSKRNNVMGEAPMTFGLTVSSAPVASTTGEDYLAVSFDTMNPQYNTKIQAKTINVWTLEHYRLTVCLDRDTHKTYKNVQRVEIFPCLDPRCNIRSRFSPSMDRDLLFSKYLDKVLSLPINTFTGVTV